VDFESNDFRTLLVDNNNLSELDIEHMTKLVLLQARDNKISTIDLSSAIDLAHLVLDNNNIQELDLDNNINLITLELSNNDIRELNLTQNVNLNLLYLNGNNNLKKVIVDDIQNIHDFKIEMTDKIIGYRNIEKTISVSDYIENIKEIDESKIKIYFNNKFLEPPIIQFDNIGLTQFSRNGIYFYNNTNEMYGNLNINYDLYVLDLTSDVYTINNDEGYIDIGDERITNDIIENLNVNYGDIQIKNNKLQILFEDELIKEFDIVTTYEEKININDFEISNSINDEAKWFNGYRGNISFNISSDDIQDFSNFDIKVLKDENEINDFHITKSQTSDILNVNISSLVSTNPNIFETGNYVINIYINENLIILKEFEIHEPIKITDIQIEDMIINYRDSSISIDYDILPKNATNKNLTFTIDDTSIAQLDIYNKIHPQTVGQTKLTLIAQDGSDIEKQVNISINDFGFAQHTFKIDYNNKIIRKINAKLSYSDFVNKFIKQDLLTFGIYSNEEEINNTDYISTNSILKSNFNGVNNNFTMIVDGDLNGDGLANAADIIFMKRYILGKNTLDDILFTAGDIDENNSVNATDIIYLKRYILGKTDNVWGS